MSSRITRRQQHKRLARFRDLPAQQRRDEVAQWLQKWRREARCRADDLHAPAVWALVADAEVREVIAAIEPSGELRADLERVCTEAVAGVAGRHLVTGSRPRADRDRQIQSVHRGV